MAKYDYDFGVIGGGSAGLTAAAGAARLGVRTVLIEAEGRLGGDCLHYGCVPSKTLIHVSSIRRHMSAAGEFGLPQPELPPVEFRKVRERILSVIATIQAHDSPERFCSLGAEVLFGRARFRDPHTVEAGDRVLTAAKWLVATGAETAPPPIPGLDKVPFLTHREIFYLDELPKSLIILGAGPEAVEMAQAFSRLGSKVTVIQRSGQILSKEDPDMAAILESILRLEGVDVRLGAMVERVEESDGLKVVHYSQEGQARSARGSHLLVSLGRRANVGELGLDQAGVEHTNKGLALDERLRTSQKHIFGAGDVTGDFQFTHAAAYEAGLVIANAVFHLPRKKDYRLMPWCTYTSPELASVGLNESRARKIGVEYQLRRTEFRTNDRSLTEGAGEGVLKLLLDRRNRPLGVQILGPRAGEMLGEWIVAMGGGVGLAKMAGLVRPYPTFIELNKAAAGEVVGEKLFSEKVRKGLSLFFGYKGRACG